MKALDAAYSILREAAEPLHYREITKRILAQGTWVTRGKTPWATVYARLTNDIQQHGDSSRFRRVEPGVFAAREPVPGVPPDGTEAKENAGELRPAVRLMSFLDAAEQVLRDSGSSEPMRYDKITERALTRGLIRTGGKTPAATLNALVGTDIRQREARGERQRFVRPARGMIALADLPDDLFALIAERNRVVRTRLLKQAREGAPADFEQLIATLLVKMGFADVEVTRLGGDGGVDVRGTLVVGDVVRVRMAVQAKRWQGNVPAPIVQQVRGSLGTHEQGLIITTSDFSRGARQQAARVDAEPVALMNGEQLAVLMAEYEVGVQREEHVLLTLDDPDEVAR